MNDNQWPNLDRVQMSGYRGREFIETEKTCQEHRKIVKRIIKYQKNILISERVGKFKRVSVMTINWYVWFRVSAPINLLNSAILHWGRFRDFKSIPIAIAIDSFQSSLFKCNQIVWLI